MTHFQFQRKDESRENKAFTSTAFGGELGECFQEAVRDATRQVRELLAGKQSALQTSELTAKLQQLIGTSTTGSQEQVRPELAVDAMLEFRYEDRHLFLITVKGELPLHAESAELDAQNIPKVGPRNIQVCCVETKPLKKHAGVEIGVLLGIDDIYVVVSEHARRRRNKPLAIFTGDHQGSSP